MAHNHPAPSAPPVEFWERTHKRWHRRAEGCLPNKAFTEVVSIVHKYHGHRNMTILEFCGKLGQLCYFEKHLLVSYNQFIHGAKFSVNYTENKLYLHLGHAMDHLILEIARPTPEFIESHADKPERLYDFLTEEWDFDPTPDPDYEEGDDEEPAEQPSEQPSTSDRD